MKPYMDYSNYPEDHPMFDKQHKAELGRFKNEFGGKHKCIEFVGLRAKCYALNLKDEKTKEISSKKVCKGLGRVAIKNRLKFEQYKKCLFKGKIKRHHFSTIRSSKHKITTVRQRKKALSHFDCKKFLFSCGLHNLPYGDYRIKHYYNSCPFCK